MLRRRPPIGIALKPLANVDAGDPPFPFPFTLDDSAGGGGFALIASSILRIHVDAIDELAAI